MQSPTPRMTDSTKYACHIVEPKNRPLAPRVRSLGRVAR